MSEQTTVQEPSIRLNVARPLSAIYGQTIHTLTFGGWCHSVSVGIDGSINENPYRIEECLVCDFPGPHPHFVEHMAVENERQHDTALGMDEEGRP